MKTPRELLLNRHAAANAKLDAIRKETIAAECGGETRNSKLETRNPKCRRVLAGAVLAASEGLGCAGRGVAGDHRHRPFTSRTFATGARATAPGSGATGPGGAERTEAPAGGTAGFSTAGGSGPGRRRRAPASE